MSPKRQTRPTARVVLPLVAAALVVLALVAALPFAYAFATTVIGQPAGDAGDGNATTFKFQGNNLDKPLTRPDLTPIARNEVPTTYGTTQGMTVYNNGVNVTSPQYTSAGGPLTPVGYDLSDAAGWPSIGTEKGQLAIDPALGRFKFFENIPHVVGTGAAPGALDVVYQNGFAFVAAGAAGLVVFDLTQPTAPLQAAQLATTNALDIAAAGRYLYIADGSAGLRIVRIDTPNNPVLVGTLDTVNAKGVAVFGRYAYIADGSGGLKIINVSNPAAPALAGSLATTDARAVVISGSYAYLADGSGGFKIIEISQPGRPHPARRRLDHRRQRHLHHRQDRLPGRQQPAACASLMSQRPPLPRSYHNWRRPTPRASLC